MEFDVFLPRAELSWGIEFNEEQRRFLEVFGQKPLISYSLPGTGKSKSAAAGLIKATMVDEIAPGQILAMSFTNAATNELKEKYSKMCRQMHIRPKVNFSTFDKLCKDILVAQSSAIGIDSASIGTAWSRSDMGDYIQDICDEDNIMISDYQKGKIITAINRLNSALIFDKKHVESRAVFKETGLDYDTFTYLRRWCYEQAHITGIIPVSDIGIYTLELLLSHPDIAEVYKDANKLILIDEVQDMSVLKLKLLSLLTDNLVAIGDIRQQIYGFTGASSQIVSEFKKYFPDHEEVTLKRSYRCGDDIAAYATRCILQNNTGGEDFMGNGSESEVVVSNKIDMKSICKDIADDFFANTRKFSKDIMFLVRNNASAIPIIEELYELGVPINAPKFIKATDIDVVTDLIALINLADNPKQMGNLQILAKLIPEFGEVRDITKNPIYRIMTKTKMSYFDIEYNYRDGEIGNTVKQRLMHVAEMLKNGDTMRNILNYLWPMYNKYYLEKNAWKLDFEPDYYIGLVQPILKEKTFREFIAIENNKEEYVKGWTERRQGVRVFTMHGAKGLEADEINIIDAEDGVMPCPARIDKLMKMGCAIEAAELIRGERCLAYVAMTRAKQKVNICYKECTSPLFLPDDRTYEHLDRVFAVANREYDNVSAFTLFFTVREWEIPCRD